jgi:hypothetical protein
MPRKRREYRFRIDAFSPETMPMVRLAEYVHDLAVVFGEPGSVHLIRLEEGSTVPVILVDWEAEPKVRGRLRDVRRREGPPDAMRAALDIDRRLERDNAKGAIVDPVGAKVIEFVGRERARLPEYGPFNQPGTLDGIPIRIGGHGDPVPLHLEDRDETHKCMVKRTLAKEIAPHLFSSVIRVEGLTRWMRHADGQWELIQFTVSGFSVLKATTLRESIDRMRAIPAGWKDLDDALGELHRLRHGPDGE